MYPFILAYGRYWVFVRGCSAIAISEDVSGKEADCKRHSGLHSPHSFEPVRRGNLLCTTRAIMQFGMISSQSQITNQALMLVLWLLPDYGRFGGNCTSSALLLLHSLFTLLPYLVSRV